MKYLFILFFLVLASFTNDTNNLTLYTQLNNNNHNAPDFETFDVAIKGFTILKDKGLVKKNIITIIDFNLSSNKKRLWVIDLDKKKIIFNTLVAHGRNTGDEFAKEFSNKPESFKSSVGFYTTAEIYKGKHGISLKIDGLEKGLNDMAREREVVIHGAPYVSESFIKQNKRLGRSLGCPALPIDINNKIIQTIKDKSCLFIYYKPMKQDILNHL
jgi:hypothetical protein